MSFVEAKSIPNMGYVVVNENGEYLDKFCGFTKNLAMAQIVDPSDFDSVAGYKVKGWELKKIRWQWENGSRKNHF